MFFLVWGWKVRSKVLATLNFFCPHEGGDRAGRRMQARKWFTLYWIPAIPLKVLGEYVECTACGHTYDLAVLDSATAAQMESQLTRAVRHVVVAMIHADGVVDPREREVGVGVVSQFSQTGYDLAALDRDLFELKVANVEQELVQAAAMLNPAGQEAVLRACLTLAAADGHVDESELKVITHAGRSLGMSPAHVRGVLAEVHNAATPPSPN